MYERPAEVIELAASSTKLALTAAGSKQTSITAPTRPEETSAAWKSAAAAAAAEEPSTAVVYTKAEEEPLRVGYDVLGGFVQDTA